MLRKTSEFPQVRVLGENCRDVLGLWHPSVNHECAIEVDGFRLRKNEKAKRVTQKKDLRLSGAVVSDHPYPCFQQAFGNEGKFSVQ